MTIGQIKRVLKQKSTKKTKLFWEKTISSKQKFYGVKITEINKISKQISPDFRLINKLWHSKYFEEKILAAKLFKKLPEKDFKKAFKTIVSFSDSISDWAVCDTLATQSLKAIASKKEIINLSKKLIKSENFWQRRFAIVSLINLAKEKEYQKQIKQIISLLKNEKEYYVKKAMIWLKKQLATKK